MNPFNNHSTQDEAQCRQMRQLLPEYQDNTLAARSVWEVEKHLAACGECAEVSREMQATVLLLQSAARQDTGDDFMAKLHARLDGLEPVPARRRSLADWMREAGAWARESVTLRRAPALSLGMAGVGVVALFAFTHLPAPIATTAPEGAIIEVEKPAVASAALHDSLPRNVALTANDPLGDVAAEYLENADGDGRTDGS